MSKRVRVNDVIDNPALQAEIDKIEREYALKEYRLCLERGRPVSKALWKRMKRYVLPKD